MYGALMTSEYRHPVEADIETITDIINRSRRELPLHSDDSVEEVRMRTFENPDYDPEQFRIVTVNGEAAGFGGALIEKSRIDAGMNDGWISMEVVPEYRGKGIEQQLMKFSEAFAEGVFLAFSIIRIMPREFYLDSFEKAYS